MSKVETMSSQIASYGVELLSAIRACDFKQVKILLNISHGLILDDDWKDYKILIEALKYLKYRSPLHCAVSLNNIGIVKKLLTIGASINCTKYRCDNNTPLYYAMQREYFDIVDLMLASYDDHDINLTDNNKIINFGIACARNNVKLLRSFIDQGMNINSFVRTSIGKSLTADCELTFLHIAVQHHSLEAVELLLSYGADFNVKDMKNLTPLYQALYQEKINEKIIELLFYAHLTKCSNPIDDQIAKDISHFYIACLKSNTANIEKFFSTGIDIDKCISVYPVHYFEGHSPLHMAIQNVDKKEKEKVIETVELLLKHNAIVNVKDAQGRTPLHWAVKRDECNKIIELLLEYNADVYSQDNEGCTPLHDAFPWYHFSDSAPLYINSEIIELLLLDDSCNFNNIQDNCGLSHFHIACASGNSEIVETFLQKRVDINESVSGKLYFWGCYTALHFATRFERVNIIQLLLKHNANLNAKDRMGLTPACLACKIIYNQFEIIIANFFNTDEMIDINEEKLNEISQSLDKSRLFDIFVLLLEHKSEATTKNEWSIELLKHAYAPDIIEKITREISSLKKSGNARDLDFFNHIFKEFMNYRKKFVHILLDHSIDLNDCDDAGNTILILIAYNNYHYNMKENIEIVEIFLKNGANPNARNKCGHTALNVAAETGFAELVEILLQYDADPNCTGNKELLTPLHSAIARITFTKQADNFDCNCTKVIELLIKYGADINGRDSNGFTPLLSVTKKSFDTSLSNDNVEPIISNYVKVIQLLITNGADVNAKDNNGSTPLLNVTKIYSANQSQNITTDKTYSDFVSIKVMQLLINHGADVNVQDIDGSTPLLIVTKEFCYMVRLLHDAANTNSNYIKAIELLINHEADVNKKDIHGSTPLLIVTKNDYSTILASNSNYIKVIELLINHRANVNAEDKDGSTPLLNFTKQYSDPPLSNDAANTNSNYVKTIKLLINHGADVNVKDINGSTPLLNVFKIYSDSHSSYNTANNNSYAYKKVIELLINYGADVNAKDNIGVCSCLMIATKKCSDNIKRTNDTASNNDNNCVKIIELLINRGVDTNVRDDEGYTPLLYAISNCSTIFAPTNLTISSYIKLINLLINHGADVNKADSNGLTALMYIAGNSWFIDIMKRIIKENCDFNMKNDAGITALHVACLRNNVDGLKLLLDHNIDMNIMETVLMSLNAFNDRIEVVNILESHIKIKLSGFKLNSDDEHYSECMEHDDYNHDRTNFTFVALCKNELERMKAIKIDRYTTLYDVLSKSSQKMAGHIKRKAFALLIESEKIKVECPLYNSLLRLQLKRATERYVLYQDARNVLQLLIGLDLPDPCLDNIFEYLTNQDLKDLIILYPCV